MNKLCWACEIALSIMMHSTRWRSMAVERRAGARNVACVTRNTELAPEGTIKLQQEATSRQYASVMHCPFLVSSYCRYFSDSELDSETLKPTTTAI